MQQSPAIARLTGYYFQLLLIIAILSLFVMMAMTVANVFMRYVFNAPIVGAYDLVEICLAISVYLALPAVIFEGQPVVIDLIDGLVSSRTVKVLRMIANVAAVVVLGFIFWSMWKPTQDAYMYGDVKPEFGFPVWIIWSFGLFGVFNSILSSVAALFWSEARASRNAAQEGTP